MSALKECPCCQGKAHVIKLENYDEETGDYAPLYAVECVPLAGCGLRTMWDARKKAIERWNARATPWQPMESAPRDGTEVLLWWPYWSNIVVIGYYDADGWNTSRCLTPGEPPQKWMPLPPPPQ